MTTESRRTILCIELRLQPENGPESPSWTGFIVLRSVLLGIHPRSMGPLISACDDHNENGTDYDRADC